MSHWYTKNGQAMHKVPGKTVAERDTTITDARKLDLLPSVSGITKVWANLGLDRWKQNATIDATLTYCRADWTGDWSLFKAHEEDHFYGEIRSMADKGMNAASDLGVKIHAAIEAELTGGKWNPTELVELSDGRSVTLMELVHPAINKVRELGVIPVENEKIITCPKHGYAGQMDMAYAQKETVGVLDFKSTKTKPGKKIDVRQGQSMQIAAYHYAYWGVADKPHFQGNHQGINLYISTTEIGRVDIITYDNAELAKQWEGFLACLTLWRLQNNYDPRTKEVV